MKIKDFFYITAILLSIGITVWSKFDEDKIAFIRTRELIDKYEGMKEAKLQLQEQLDKFKGVKDSLHMVLKVEIENYKSDSLSYTREEKIKKKELLRHLQYNIYNIDEKIKSYSLEQDEKIVSQILNQLNEYITQFGEQHNYKIIFGTLETGNVLYGTDAIDITEDIIEKANFSYLGQKK